jgi:hypothetical protein
MKLDMNGPLIMSIILIVSCYTGFFNVRRGWQSLNTGPRFYLRLIRMTGWLLIYTSRTSRRKHGQQWRQKLTVHFIGGGNLHFQLFSTNLCFVADTHLLCIEDNLIQNCTAETLQKSPYLVLPTISVSLIKC